MIAAAGGAGYHVSRPQLSRWHRAGLLQRPWTVGLGQGRGSAVFYPAGTARQLIALCEFRARHRNLDDIGWLLWWNGYHVGDGIPRTFLAKAAYRWRAWWAEMLTEDGRLTEQTEALLDRADEIRLRPTLARARRRVGTKDFDQVLEVIVAVATGTAADLPDDQVKLFERATALDRARQPTPALPSGWLGDDIREALALAAPLFDPRNLLALTENVSAEELEVAATQVRAVSTIVSAVTRLVEAFDPQAYGFGPLAAALEELLGEPQSQAIVLLFWHAIRKTDLGPGMDQILEFLPQAHWMMTLRQIVDLIHERIPRSTEMLPDRLIAAAAIDERRREDLAQRFQALRADYADQIDAVLSQFSELPADWSV